MAIPSAYRQLFDPAFLNVSDDPGVVDVTEKDPGGAGTLKVQINAPHAWLQVQGEKIFWVVNPKCSDGGIIVECEDGIHVHLIELKSKISTQAWDRAKTQLQGMYHNLLSILSIARLGPPAKVTCHVAYSEDAIAALPALHKALVTDDGVSTPAVLEWTTGIVHLDGTDHAKLIKYERDGHGHAVATIDC